MSAVLAQLRQQAAPLAACCRHRGKSAGFLLWEISHLTRHGSFSVDIFLQRHSTPTAIKLLPLPTPHAVAVFKETGEVSVARCDPLMLDAFVHSLCTGEPSHFVVDAHRSRSGI